ncbi:peptidoglycan-binding domain-containing protein [Actinophytocola xanthii]|uniref:Peptidoglycan binding-like domain-containing protein n=1 Tax=Actinophytocola xanthii TaxID=1912961 RepID=A0A1Q8BYU5_9PSEU|nr:peptidoglycan-binding domain-containing protein [Actinophytocola xanthii]OLF07290.1 hypothetical protein BU204_35690 [Actinophytocola xanthii]OLF07464.1 hypothetical protein BU204_35570 [Actinophytocola xanthii]
MTHARSILAAVALTAAGVLSPLGAPSAAAATYCDAAIVWQNAYVAGNSSTLHPNCISSQGAGPNNAVSSLQLSLRDCHHRAIGVDGHFGPETRRVLTSVQASLGISADGVYGPQTARAMSHRRVGGGPCLRITF